MAKQSFIDTLLNLHTTNRSALYSSADITDKILFMSTPVPTNKVVRHRWQRLHLRYKIVSYDSSKYLYLRGRGENPTGKRVLAIEDLYEVLRRTHIEHNHVRKLGLHKCLSEQYHGVTDINKILPVISFLAATGM